MDKLKILLSKGRIYDNVCRLLNDIGVALYLPERTYFPITNREDLDFQVVKPQVASLLLAQSKADLCFSGEDWVQENGVASAITQVIDLGFDKVKIVAAIPESCDFNELIKGDITVATEYEALSRKWLASKKLQGTVFYTWGTSEGYVRTDASSPAQILIDNTSTGSSLRANRLKVVDTLMESSTRMYALNSALCDPAKKAHIDSLVMLFRSVLLARQRVMLEMNVAKKNLNALVAALPAMQSPTVAPLFNSDSFAIKTVVLKDEVAALLPKLHALGATAIIEYELRKVME